MDKFGFDGYFNEALEYMKKGDTVQASEKLYKCAEESVKLLSERFNLPEYEEAKNNDRWNAALLFRAVRNLSEKVSKDIFDCWTHSWFLHTEGFHERRLDKKEVELRIKYVEKLINLSNP